MRRYQIARKDREGVSPVIATILMVAITVVLAAVLMVMVMGMTAEPEPVVRIDMVEQYSGEWVVRLTYVSVTMDTDDVEIFAFINGDYAPLTGVWAMNKAQTGSVFRITDDGSSGGPDPDWPVEVSLWYKGRKLAHTMFDPR